MVVISSERSFGPYSFSINIDEDDEQFRIIFGTSTDKVVLHWGVGTVKTKEWKNPLEISGISIPDQTVKFDEKAAQSQFLLGADEYQLEIIVQKTSAVLQINFVFKRENAWFNNNSNDYFITLKPPTVPQILRGTSAEINEFLFEIVEAETNGGAWTLMHRFKLCQKWVERLNKDFQGLAWIFVWMRYSAIRKLEWQRNYNTKPVELAWSQKNLTYAVSNSLKSIGLVCDLVGIPILLKGLLMNMGKSGENGQRIRDEILHIMSRGKIKYHNPALDKYNYYEQWHQKLHNNTTFDDIGICEAIIAYNESGNMQTYWDVLSKHGITKERLCSFDRPITVEPYMAPQIVPDLYNYLALLKSVHGSVDLQQSVSICKGFLSSSQSSSLVEVVENLKHWDKISQMGRVLKARKELKSSFGTNNSDQFRELVYLDIGLEAFTRQICEEIIHLDIEVKYKCKQLEIVIENILIYTNNEELSAAFEDFKVFAKLLEEHPGYDSGLLVKSSCDRLQRTLGKFVDLFSELIDPKAKFLGSEFGVDVETQNLFVEEIIRGSLFFAVSILVKKIDKDLRQFIGLKDCQIISPKSVSGLLMKLDSLTSISYEKFDKNVIFICEKVSGEEDIPEGVVGVISKNELDILAHISVRARNSSVFLAVVLDEETINRFLILENCYVSVTFGNGTFDLKQNFESHERRRSFKVQLVKEPVAFSTMFLPFDDFAEGKTGAKGNNCLELKKRLPSHIHIPKSAAIPYGSYEHVLGQNYNSSVKSLIDQVIETGLLSTEETTDKLKMIQSLISKLEVQNPDKATLLSLLNYLACPELDFEAAWTAVKQVWASKYNLRVFLNSVKSRIEMESIRMSVLCQEVINGDYAFVLHTKNPMTDNPNEIYGEIVLGLGETLVSAADGRALAFVVNKHTGEQKIETVCNKSEVLKGSGFIFRSDSNSEDLPGFAGAGLFDSFTMNKPRALVPKYSKEEIVMNPGFRSFVIAQLREVGILVEEVYSGIAQDIEGCIKDGIVFVVQSRPQV